MTTRTTILTSAILALATLAALPVANAQLPTVPNPTSCLGALPEAPGEVPPACTDFQGELEAFITTVATCAISIDPEVCILGYFPEPTTTPPTECKVDESDKAHSALCIATANLGLLPVFEVDYADTEDLYLGTSDDDEPVDYAVIRVLDESGDEAMRVQLLIDLQQGGNPATPAEGPLVSVFTHGIPVVRQAGPSQPANAPPITIDLGEVHLQDPRHGGLLAVDLDDDGLRDADEALCLPTMSSPLSKESTCADVDGDGLDAAGEADKGTDPRNWDTDGDGDPDGADTDPLNPSTTQPADDDSDGVPNGADNCPQVANPDQANMDEESLPLGDTKGDACDDDIDGDGLSNDQEEGREPPTDPENADTDGDGFEDGHELTLLSDPTDAESTPATPPADPLQDFLNPLEILTNDDCDRAAVATDADCRTDGPLPTLIDRTDPHDIDDDGVTNEQNGQVDLVETLIVYVDPDERGEPSHTEKEKNSDLEGGSGLTVVAWDQTATGKEMLRLHIGNGGPGGDRPIEAFVLEEGPRNSPTAVTCVYTEGGQPYVVLNNGGGQYDGSRTTQPCGPPVSAIAELNAIGKSLGSVVFVAMAGPEEPLPLFELTDANGDGIPEFVTLNLPDPDSCTAEAQGCTDYADPLDLPSEDAPSPDDLCTAEDGTFPGCLVPTPPPGCPTDPEACEPPEGLPCEPEEPEGCAPEDPTGDAIPPCSEVDTTQPAYVCFTDDESGGAVTKYLGMNKIKVAVPGGPPVFL